MYKIAIDAGHGLKTAGKRCLKSIDPNETREWKLNARIADKVCEKLKSNGAFTYIRTDDVTGATDVPLNTRTKNANAFGADALVSIHHNAGINGGWGGGCVVIRQQGLSESTKAAKLQSDIYSKVIEKTGLKGNRAIPKPTQNLHMTRESKMPATLIECGFMDSKTDVPIILSEDFANKCAAGIYEGICEYFGVSSKSSEEKKYMPEKGKFKINGEVKEIERILVDGSNYINLRQLCDALGVNVDYDVKENLPIIEKE